jgi:hypothetical protein
MIMAAAPNNKYSQIYTPEMIEELSNDIQEYAANTRNAHFAAWARGKGKSPSWIMRMSEDYPQFAQAYEDAKIIMSAKLVNGSIYNDDPKFNPTQAMAYMPVYNREFRDFLKWKAEIAREQPSKEEAKAAINEYVEQQKNV